MLSAVYKILAVWLVSGGLLTIGLCKWFNMSYND